MEGGMLLTSSILYLLRSFRLDSAQHGPQHSARGKNSDADKLRRREMQRAVDMDRGVIAPERFHNRARDRVAQQVGRKHLAVEFLVTVKPCKSDIQNQAQNRIVKFGGMHALRIRFVAGREMNRPRQTAFPPVTAAIQETTNPSKHVTQRDARCEHVRQFPECEVFKARIKNARERSANQSAVENKAAVPHREHL